MDEKTAHLGGQEWVYQPLNDSEKAILEPQPPTVTGPSAPRQSRGCGTWIRRLAIITVGLYVLRGSIHCLSAWSSERAALGDSDILPYDIYRQTLSEYLPVDDQDQSTCEEHTIDAKMFDSSSKTLNFKLTTAAERIRVYAHGPIAGNATLTSGGTSGDDIEVDVAFHRPTHPGHHRPCGGKPPSSEPSEDTWPPWGRHGPVKVKICPTLDEEGRTTALGLYAYRENRRHHPHGPHGHPSPDAWMERASRWRGFTASRAGFGGASGPKPPKPPHPPHRPEHPPPSIALATIDIRFPSKSDSLAKEKPLVLKAFESDLYAFKQKVDDLNVSFERLLLVGDIEAKGVSAGNVFAISPFGSISGNFSASQTVGLVTAKGSIDASVALFSQASSDPVRPATLSLVSSKGSIAANVSLLTYDSADDATHPPSYLIKSTSSLSHADINIESQPVGSILSAETFSRFGHTTLKLNPAFEGAFDLTSAWSKPVVNIPEDTKDPSGEGRKRVVDFKKAWGSWTVRGTVQWVKDELNPQAPAETLEDRAKAGVLKLTTIKAPAILNLG